MFIGVRFLMGFFRLVFMVSRGWIFCSGVSICLQWGLVSGLPELADLVVVFDFLGLRFVGVVRLISGCVFIYSSGYIGKEEWGVRFLLVLFSFVVSIGLLVLVPSVVGVILGWDGLGLSSFLLVVYYQDKDSLSSGVLTALSNRIGDGLILVSMGMGLVNGQWCVFYGGCYGTLFCLAVLVARITKRAQMPFCSWLPAAMAAPTPVRSLVHSSTLVAAGIYLLIRYGEVFCEGDLWGRVLMVVGCFTFLMSGVGAILEGDVKKIVALSTLRQLGMMVFVLGLGHPMLCLFHTYIHAVFKALLFMGVGVIIHSRQNQDVYGLSSCYWDMPFARGIVVLASFCLGGVPFLCGYFSKDLMVEVCLGRGVGVVFLFGVVVGVILTVMYSFRLCYRILCGVVNHRSLSGGPDCLVMRGAIVGLGVACVFVGEVVGGLVEVSSWVSLEVGVKLVPIVVLFGGIYLT